MTNGKEQFWNDVSKDFDAIYSKETNELQNLLNRIFRMDMYERFVFTMENTGPLKGKRILDVGCGPGYYTLEFAKKGALKAIGIDYSEKMIEIAEQRKAHLNLNCDFITADILAYEPDDRFEISIAMGLFDYTKDPLPILRKMKELTTEKIILSFPRLFTWRAPIRKMRLMRNQLDVYFYSKGHIKALFHELSLNDYKIVRIGKLFCAIAII